MQSGRTSCARPVTLAASGTYTVLIGDCGDTSTGNYSIYTQRTNNLAGSVSLSLAQVQTGMIGSAAINNTYTFSASANDLIDFTVAASGSMSPRLRLYSPSGALLNDQANRYNDGVCSGGAVIELNTVKLAASGAYTVLAGDRTETEARALSGDLPVRSQKAIPARIVARPLSFWLEIGLFRVRGIDVGDHPTWHGGRQCDIP